MKDSAYRYILVQYDFPLTKDREKNVPIAIARFFRPSFRENKLKPLVFYDWKRAFWAYFRENWVYKFVHCCVWHLSKGATTKREVSASIEQ